jgi:hypothetical protein
MTERLSADPVLLRNAISNLWRFARKVDKHLNNGGLPTPRNDRERRMCAHWRAVGMREAAMGFEEMLGLEPGDLDTPKNARIDGSS